MTVALAITTWGGGERRALLIHGLSSSAAGWWRLAPDVASLGFTVTAPDLRGHGDSGDGDGFHLTAYRDDVLALGGGWDLVLGHSLGGLVTLACQLASPGFARALILEDPAIGLPVDENAADALMAEYASPITVESVAASRPRWDQRDVEAKVAALQAAGPHVVGGTLRALATDLWVRLDEVGVPLLVVGADRDLDTTVTRSGVEAAGRVGEFVVIPGASHSIHRDSYEAFWDVIGPWISRHAVSP